MNPDAPESACIRVVWHHVGTRIGLYDVIARLLSIALQYAPLEKLSDLLTSAKFEPCGPGSGHDRLKHCTSLPDLIGRHLLVTARDGLPVVSRSPSDSEAKKMKIRREQKGKS